MRSTPFKEDQYPARSNLCQRQLWLFETGLKPDSRILEHSVPMPNYNGVLTLLLIPEEIEDRASEALLEELDPEKFTLRRKTWPGPR